MPLVAPHPGASTLAVSRRMSAARRRDTKPELDVRRLLHARGMRYRVAYPVPGLARRSVDIAFTRAKVAIFLDGCFWHSCPEHGTKPRSNAGWWAVKLQANAARDIQTTAVLSDLGWTVLRFWEHEDPAAVADRVQVIVSTRRSTIGPEHSAWTRA
ncbi:very short patch repair endonuclease [Cellulosimicrobium funkei]|uniref:very short patch repair endonuclease n=1 Tax=Cellulosimicrobium funkei TaxID=264251 RepID=UPI0037DC87DF